MRIFVIASALFTGASAAMLSRSPGHGTGPACLRYQPDTVAIAGLLTRKTFPGRPNYESVKEGDGPETGFYLVAGLIILVVWALSAYRPATPSPAA